jgi:simple sugar transport system ATP-binding protein
MMGELAVEMKGITKIFGSLVANDNVDLKIEKGHIHALLGENGAGKTTLMNILYGLYTAEFGEIYPSWQKVEINEQKTLLEKE